MIQYLENKHINKEKWDACLEHSVNSRIYAYSWYLDMVHPEWSALVMDDYQAIFPIASRKKLGIRYAFQPVFTQQHGLYTPLLLTHQLLDSFLKKLISLFPLIQINLNSYNRTQQYQNLIKQQVNHELDLISTHAGLKKYYSKNLKRNLKKAQKTQLSIFKNIQPNAVITLFKENKGKKLKAFSENDYQTLNRLIYKAIKKNKVEIWGVFTPENNLCAGAIFIKNQGRFTFLFSATNQEARDNGAMSYLIDSFIEAHATTKSILDFEGSNDPNLARFYKSFGSTVVQYPYFFYNHLPWHLSFVWKLKQWIN